MTGPRARDIVVAGGRIARPARKDQLVVSQRFRLPAEGDVASEPKLAALSVDTELTRIFLRNIVVDDCFTVFRDAVV